MGRRLVWRFADVDHEGAWGFGVLSGNELVELLKHMANFESMTIRELFYMGDEPGKHYAVDALPAEALARLVQLRREDETALARLRTAAKRRLYGFLRDNVFHVLWWDPEHKVYPSKVYPSKPRNT